MCCCCCPPAISALFCLWCQSGCSKGTVAGALTFFPPDPPLYKFERRDQDGNLLPDVDDDDVNGKDDDGKVFQEQPDGTQSYRAKEGQAREKAAETNNNPAQQLTDRAKELRRLAKGKNARDAADEARGVVYSLILDSRLSAPRFPGGGRQCLECVKVKVPKTGAYVAAIIYRVPPESLMTLSEQEQNNGKNNGNTTPKVKTIIYSHGNATDIGAMFPLQTILAHSLGVNVVSYDYSGYGESGGVPLECNTYTDLQAVYEYTLEHLCEGDPSRVILYGQSVGSGPCCHLATNPTKSPPKLGGMILHSPFTSGMRVLTPSRALACLDIYPNIDRIPKVSCPVMVIHGRLDEEVPMSHGVALHEAVPSEYQRDPWWVRDRGHNDITEGPGKLAEYLRRLRRFLENLDGKPSKKQPYKSITPRTISSTGGSSEASTALNGSNGGPAAGKSEKKKSKKAAKEKERPSEDQNSSKKEEKPLDTAAS